jgi:hypothetical protein
VRGILISILLCHGSLVASFAWAQDKSSPPPKTDLGFDASKVPPPDPKRGKPLLRVLDQYIYPDEWVLMARLSERDRMFYLQCYVLGPLFDRFKDREKIEPTREELEQLEAFLKNRNMDTAGGLTELWWYRLHTSNKTPGQDRIDAVMLWKIERELFNRYGGVVTFSKFRSPMPFDAYRKFLEDAERTRAFEIIDKEVRAAFFERFRGKPRFVVPPDKVDLDTPWWAAAEADKAR